MASAVAAAGFHILDEEPPLPGLQQPHRPAPLLAAAAAREALEELHVDERQNQGAVVDCRLEAGVGATKALKSKLRVAWRPQLAGRRDVDNPLPCRRPPIDSKTFEPLDAVLEETSVVETEAAVPASRTDAEHPLAALTADCNVEEQVEKHLAGQFEWLITYPAPADSMTSEDVVYGCTFLRRNQRRTSLDDDAHSGPRAANSYAFLATRLKAGAHRLPDMHASGDGSVEGPGAPLTAPKVATMVEQALSPWLSVVSERGSSAVDGSSRAGSCSGPRIEDSLEELDKLEEQLEAVEAAATPKTPVDHQTPADHKTPDHKTPAAAKRASVAGHAATVRVKASEKTRPTVRRSASLTLRDKKADAAEPKPPSSLPRTRSSKPPTVPKFELPGDAVARRLREQRDARQAQQQAEALRAQASPARRRPLARPTFELPGEAISRRKREEREARLRAEEDEERRRREFKARPVRHSTGPATLPRDTVASRARQRRLSKSPPPPPRTRTAAATRDERRAAAASTTGKRCSMSADEPEAQRQRGRDMMARDGDATARLAREQAAARSGTASREWADKRRRREA